MGKAALVVVAEAVTAVVVLVGEEDPDRMAWSKQRLLQYHFSTLKIPPIHRQLRHSKVLTQPQV